MRATISNPVRSIVVQAALLLCLSCTAFAQLPEPNAVPEIERELSIMSKVLEDELDRKGIEDWHRVTRGASPFEPKIKVSYVPTVGAIFNIAINFPVIDHAEEPEDEEIDEKEPEEDDLWERHSGGAENLPGDIASQINVRVAEAMREAGEAVRESRSAVKEAGAYLITAGGLANRSYNGSSPFYAGVRQRTAEAYDAEKVERLRRALVESIASYGYRLEHLADSERILLIVEAPGDSTFSLAGTLTIRGGRPGSLDRTLSIFGGFPSAGTGGDARSFAATLLGIAKEREDAPAEVRVKEDLRVVAGDQMRIVLGQFDAFPLRLRFPGPTSAPTDHYLISIRKADVTSKVTFEELEAKVEEHRY
ncbi:hypothetical protein IIC65_00330 [Candidatus Sumerlaeota bacterium]|nr:hypothetical protein [Candidatus Sumerlaeota bacterium]